jgi:sterol desaturase/sphingolipid hydroxylase (fatty acid hydroxylase superfamily)
VSFFHIDHELLYRALAIALSLTGLGLILAAIGSVVAFHQQGGGTFREFIRYVLPREILTRRSCYQDVGFVIVKRLLRPWIVVPLLITSIQCAFLTYDMLTNTFGTRAQAPVPWPMYAVLLIVAVLIQDFLRFGSHYLLHFLAPLWDVHKVHHSADYLTPITNHRSHILEELSQQAVTAISVGPLLGAAAYITSTAVTDIKLLGFEAYVLLDALPFAILRHSHIGLSFGPLERFLMSPKQHHLHHSVDQRHWNKNFGFFLSCWDRMAGTLAYSNPREKLRLGIPAAEFQDYDTVLKLHFMPYVKLFRHLVHWRPAKGRTRTTAAAQGPASELPPADRADSGLSVLS